MSETAVRHALCARVMCRCEFGSIAKNPVKKKSLSRNTRREREHARALQKLNTRMHNTGHTPAHAL